MFRHAELAEEQKLLGTGAKTTYSYRALVGGLMYLATRTRMDISHAVAMLAHHSQQPRIGDLKRAMRVLQYLNGTREDGLKVNLREGFGLEVFEDAAWISDQQANTWMGHIVMATGYRWCGGEF